MLKYRLILVYEYYTKKDLGYKPDAVEKAKFEYSPIGKVFTYGLAKEDKSKTVGLFKRLKILKIILSKLMIMIIK